MIGMKCWLRVKAGRRGTRAAQVTVQEQNGQCLLRVKAKKTEALGWHSDLVWLWQAVEEDLQWTGGKVEALIDAFSG